MNLFVKKKKNSNEILDFMINSVSKNICIVAAPNFSRFWIMMISTTIQLLVYQRSIGKYRPGIHSALFLPDLQEVPDFHCSPAHNNTGLYIITSEKLITLRGKKSVNYWSFIFFV